MTTEPTTFNPPDLPTTPSTGSTFARFCAHSASQWVSPTFEEIARFEYAPSPAQHPTAYLHALHVIYFVRDVKVRELEDALRRHAEQHALSYELWPSLTLLPIYEKAITELFDNAEYLAAQLRSSYFDPAVPGNNAQAMNANTAKALGLSPELNPCLKEEKKLIQPYPESRERYTAPELTCESLQRQWGVTIVRSAQGGIKDARVAVFYDSDLLTIDKQHNRQPLRKLKGRKHNAD